MGTETRNKKSEDTRRIMSRIRFLKMMPALTDEEKNELENLTNKTDITYSPPAQKDTKPSKIIQINEDLISRLFLQFFEQIHHKKFIINEDNREVFRALCKYFAKDNSFSDSNLSSIVGLNFSLSKGIFLAGSVGTGKTSMMDVFMKVGVFLFQKLGYKHMLFRKYNCKKIVSDYMNKSNIEGQNLDKYHKNNIYFDDLGTEQKAYNHNLMQDILEERYDQRAITFLTSNLSLKDIEDRYDVRVRDRFNEMFNIIPLDGKSFRK